MTMTSSKNASTEERSVATRASAWSWRPWPGPPAPGSERLKCLQHAASDGWGATPVERPRCEVVSPADDVVPRSTTPRWARNRFALELLQRPHAAPDGGHFRPGHRAPRRPYLWRSPPPPGWRSSGLPGSPRWWRRSPAACLRRRRKGSGFSVPAQQGKCQPPAAHDLDHADALSAKGIGVRRPWGPTRPGSSRRWYPSCQRWQAPPRPWSPAAPRPIGRP